MKIIMTQVLLSSDKWKWSEVEEKEYIVEWLCLWNDTFSPSTDDGSNRVGVCGAFNNYILLISLWCYSIDGTTNGTQRLCRLIVAYYVFDKSYHVAMDQGS